MPSQTPSPHRSQQRPTPSPHPDDLPAHHDRPSPNPSPSNSRSVSPSPSHKRNHDQEHTASRSPSPPMPNAADSPQQGEYESGKVLCQSCNASISFRDEATGKFNLKLWEAHRQSCSGSRSTTTIINPNSTASASMTTVHTADPVIYTPESTAQALANPPAKRRRAKRTEEERIAYLRADPYVADFEPYRVLCASCDKWIRLRPNSTYCSIPWDAHRKSCLAKKINSKNVYALEERNNVFAKDPEVRKFDAERALCNMCDRWIPLNPEDHLQAVQKWLHHRASCQRVPSLRSSAAGASAAGSSTNPPLSSTAAIEGNRPSPSIDQKQLHSVQPSSNLVSHRPPPTASPPGPTTLGSTSTQRHHQHQQQHHHHQQQYAPSSPAPSPFHDLNPANYAPIHESRRRNAEQRAATLRADSLIGEVEPNRVFCSLCQKGKCLARHQRRVQKATEISDPKKRGIKTEEDELMSDSNDIPTSSSSRHNLYNGHHAHHSHHHHHQRSHSHSAGVVKNEDVVHLSDDPEPESEEEMNVNVRSHHHEDSRSRRRQGDGPTVVSNLVVPSLSRNRTVERRHQDHHYLAHRDYPYHHGHGGHAHAHHPYQRVAKAHHQPQSQTQRLKMGISGTTTTGSNMSGRSSHGHGHRMNGTSSSSHHDVRGAPQYNSSGVAAAAAGVAGVVLSRVGHSSSGRPWTEDIDDEMDADGDLDVEADADSVMGDTVVGGGGSSVANSTSTTGVNGVGAAGYGVSRRMSIQARRPWPPGLSDLDSPTGRRQFVHASVEYLFATTYESTDDMSISTLLAYLNAAMPVDKHEDFDTSEVTKAALALQDKGRFVLEGDMLRIRV